MRSVTAAGFALVLEVGPWVAQLPAALTAITVTASVNANLYDDKGLAAARAALKPGGIYAVWSAREDRRFEQRLRYADFDVPVERVRGRLKKGGPRHVIFLGAAPA